MALVTCPKCNREISDQADACPHCGMPLAKIETDGKATSAADLDRQDQESWKRPDRQEPWQQGTSPAPSSQQATPPPLPEPSPPPTVEPEPAPPPEPEPEPDPEPPQSPPAQPESNGYHLSPMQRVDAAWGCSGCGVHILSIIGALGIVATWIATGAESSRADTILQQLYHQITCLIGTITGLGLIIIDCLITIIYAMKNPPPPPE